MTLPSTGRPELPGFTYDEAMSRYVKILPDHHARNLTGVAKLASREAVKDATTYRKRQREEEEKKTIKSKSRITRSRIYQHGIIGMSVSREIASQTQSMVELYGQAWSQSIRPRHSVPNRRSGSWYMMSKASHKDALLAVRHDADCASDQGSKLNIVFGNSDDGIPKWLPYETSFGLISSISIAGRYAFLTTVNDDDHNIICTIPTADHIDDAEFVPRAYNIKKPSAQHYYWCASFHPDISKLSLAVGTGKGILIHNPFCSHGHGIRDYTRTDASAPTLSIQWKSENVVASGLRDGTVHLYDIRARDRVLRLRSNTCVKRLRCIDDSKILVGGPGQLDMYDLRYTKSARKSRSSNPWLHYQNYDNLRLRSFDIDLSVRLGLLAVALETTTEIWNLWTGSKIHKLNPSPSAANSIRKSEVVMFTRDNHKTHFFTEESDPVGLLIADDSQILEWNLEAKHLVGTVDAET